jgi:hypothetical protein
LLRAISDRKSKNLAGQSRTPATRQPSRGS